VAIINNSEETMNDTKPLLSNADKLVRIISTAFVDKLDQSNVMDKVLEIAANLDSADSIDPHWAPVQKDPTDNKDPALCSEATCDQPSRARGLCSKHYQRLRYAEKRAKEEGFSVPSSLAEVQSSRLRKTARKTARRGGSVCTLDDCERDTYAKGMCGKHFMEWVRSKKKN
jgi:hypothetical protein